VFIGVLLLLELGRRTGRRRAARPEGARAEVSVMDGAVFTLLGLLVAFTFSGAAARWDARRQLLVEEANAIGTAYLRLDVLPPDAQPALREKFRQYVDARLAIYRSLPDFSGAKAELARAAKLQAEIWAQAVAACRNEGSQPARILVLPALNAMIDITTTPTPRARTLSSTWPIRVSFSTRESAYGWCTFMKLMLMKNKFAGVLTYWPLTLNTSRAGGPALPSRMPLVTRANIARSSSDMSGNQVGSSATRRTTPTISTTPHRRSCRRGSHT
jgi:hypothetical protein